MNGFKDLLMMGTGISAPAMQGVCPEPLVRASLPEGAGMQVTDSSGKVLATRVADGWRKGVGMLAGLAMASGLAACAGGTVTPQQGQLFCLLANGAIVAASVAGAPVVATNATATFVASVCNAVGGVPTPPPAATVPVAPAPVVILPAPALKTSAKGDSPHGQLPPFKTPAAPIGPYGIG